MSYHVPVLLNDCIEGLAIKPTGVYVDVTFGGGGHSKEILKHLHGGRLFGFDQDADAYANVPEDSQFTLIRQNFRYLKNYLRFYGITQVDGILADLGVSSHQFDEAERGFSLRFDGPLDMRMNQNSPKMATHILNEYDHGPLARVFQRYGEIHNAGKLASEILVAREKAAFITTTQLREVAEPLAPRKKVSQYLAQVFQALRIELNDEMVVLQEMLTQAGELLVPGGRLVVMSYHSLEDRLVKNFIRSGNFEGEVEKDFFGNELKPLRALNKKVIIPTEEEILQNPRSRSAKLRIAEKI